MTKKEKLKQIIDSMPNGFHRLEITREHIRHTPTLTAVLRVGEAGGPATAGPTPTMNNVRRGAGPTPTMNPAALPRQSRNTVTEVRVR